MASRDFRRTLHTVTKFKFDTFQQKVAAIMMYTSLALILGLSLFSSTHGKESAIRGTKFDSKVRNHHAGLSLIELVIGMRL